MYSLSLFLSLFLSFSLSLTSAEHGASSSTRSKLSGGNTPLSTHVVASAFLPNLTQFFKSQCPNIFTT